MVFNQTKIGEEYKRYFDYLATRKMIKDKVEELELEELPGANGLKALRVEIATPTSPAGLKKDDLLRDIEAAVRMH